MFKSLPTTTILALRSLWAFVLSQLDYVSSGVVVPPAHVKDLAIQTRAYYRHGLGLPYWISRTPMALPSRYGGPGCPHLPLRTTIRLLLTYAQATYSRSLIARSFALYVSGADLPGSEARPLAAAAHLLSVELSEVCVARAHGLGEQARRVTRSRCAWSA